MKLDDIKVGNIVVYHIKDLKKSKYMILSIERKNQLGIITKLYSFSFNRIYSNHQITNRNIQDYRLLT